MKCLIEVYINFTSEVHRHGPLNPTLSLTQVMFSCVVVMQIMTDYFFAILVFFFNKLLLPDILAVIICFFLQVMTLR